jgi:hypothetical protein
MPVVWPVEVPVLKRDVDHNDRGRGRQYDEPRDRGPDEERSQTRANYHRRWAASRLRRRRANRKPSGFRDCCCHEDPLTTKASPVAKLTTPISTMLLRRPIRQKKHNEYALGLEAPTHLKRPGGLNARTSSANSNWSSAIPRAVDGRAAPAARGQGLRWVSTPSNPGRIRTRGRALHILPA